MSLTPRLDLLKVERMVKMSQLNPQDMTRHESVDTRFTSNVILSLLLINNKKVL